MAELVNKTLDVVSGLPLHSLEEDWVKACWDNHFLDATPLPLATENLLREEGYFIQQLESLHYVARLWQESNSDADGLWSSLRENNISHKTLVALLAYLIPMEHSAKTLHGQKKEAAFVAAKVYLSLISLPGSRAFKVYSPDLLLRAVNLLKSGANFGQAGTKKRSAQVMAASQKTQSQASKRSRHSTRQIPSSQMSSQDSTTEDVEDAESDKEEDDDDSSPNQIQRFRSLYINLLTELVALLSTFSLRESLTTVEQVLKTVACLTRVDNHLFDGCFPLRAQGRKQDQGVSALAFKGLLLLCQPLHGDVTALTTSACKHMLPNALMLLDGNKVCTSQTFPKELQLGRDHTIAWLKFMLKETGEPCHMSIKILLQHMCMRVPDKAEYRSKAAQAVVTVVQEVPDTQYAFMMKWIGVLTRNEKSNVRAFALEVLTLLLTNAERQLHGVTEEDATCASHAFLVNLLLARCSDVAAAVRTRAITGFAQCLESGGVAVKSTIQEMITPRTNTPHPPRLIPTPNDLPRTVQQSERTMNETSQGEGTNVGATDEAKGGNGDDATPVTPAAQTPNTDKPLTPFRSVELAEGLDNSLPDRQGVISMLHRRAKEEKVFVRKAALQALHKFILFEAPAVRKEDIDVLCERCRDKALAVRKQSLASLTEVLLQCPRNPMVQSAWLKGALSMVWDQETSIQDKCLETVETILLHNLVPFHRSKSEDAVMAWEILTLISKPENAELRRHFRKVCRLWERQKMLKSSLISSIMSHIGTDNNQAAWSVLADLAVTKVRVDTKPVVEYWRDHKDTITGATEGDVWENVLRIISFNAQSISADLRCQLIDEFKAHLLRFELKPVLVSAFTSAIYQLSEVESNSPRQRQEWGREVLLACDQYLSTIVLDEDMSGDVSFDEDKTMCYLYTLGVVALMCPSVTPKRAPMLVQSFIASPCISAAGDSPDVSASSKPSQTSQGSEASEEGSQGTQGSQATQGSQSTQPLSQFRGCKMSDRVRAVAFLTLGKVCLQDKSVAKKCVPAMARELEVSSSDAVRNNIIIILRDLCVRYTTLVDPYVSNMATCLRDPAPIVRRQTLELLTGLLQEDYLKWKGSLFFRFVLTLLDPHPEISAFAEFCLGYHLLKRHPAMMFHHLLESIFVFNDYDKHNVFNKYTQSDRERDLFSLKGKENQSQRMKLYQFMLEHMEDEHRFQLTSKISQEVLGAVVDGILPYDQDSCDLLQDALAILSSKEIKLSSLRTSKSVEDAADEMEMANAVMATAKKTLITQVVKKNVMENVIPLVLSLKHMMDKERSPLLKDLMTFLRELMKDYKNEIKDILAADKQLACEIEYDLRMFENQQAAAAEQGQTTPGNGTPVQVKAGGNTPLARPSTPLAKPATPVAGAAGKNTPSTGSARKGTPVVEERGTAVSSGTPRAQSRSGVDSATRQATLRTVEQLKERRRSGVGQDRRRLSSVKWADNVVARNAATSESESESVEKEKPATPRCPRRPLRAISTPSGLLNNVTFAGEGNMTLPMVPPSPIPGHSKSQANVTGEEENEEVNIVFMELPGAERQAKPREWKVKVKSEEQVAEASQPAVMNSPIVSRNRRSRHLQTST